MHILLPETDNCPSWISGRERMTVENISWSISTKECCRPWQGLNLRPPGLQSDVHPTEPPRPTTMRVVKVNFWALPCPNHPRFWIFATILFIEMFKISVIINPFTPDFLEWPLSSLHMDVSQNQQQKDKQCRSWWDSWIYTVCKGIWFGLQN